jgi:hypothetical protein
MARQKPWYVIVASKRDKQVVEYFGIGPIKTEEAALVKRREYPVGAFITQTPTDTIPIIRPLEAQQ